MNQRILDYLQNHPSNYSRPVEHESKANRIMKKLFAPVRLPQSREETAANTEDRGNSFIGEMNNVQSFENKALKRDVD